MSKSIYRLVTCFPVFLTIIFLSCNKTPAGTEPGEPDVDATLYINSQYSFEQGLGKLYAFNVETGTLVFKYPLSTGGGKSSPVYYKGAVIEGLDYTLAAINLDRRSLRWSIPTGYNASNPTIANGVVYANGMDQYLYAVDALTGNIKWKYKYAKYQYLVNAGGPTYMDGVVYIADADGNVFAINAETGNLVWTANDANSKGSGGFYGNPCVADGVLYIADFAGNFFAINVSDGSYKWRTALGYQTVGSPTIAKGIVYISSQFDYLFALDAKTGKELWKFYVGNVEASPFVSNGIVYIATSIPPSKGGIIYAFNAVNGNLIWKLENENNFYSSPVVYNNILFIASYNNVFAIDAATGIMKWEYNTGDELENFYSSPIVVDGKENLFTSGVSGNRN